MNILSRSIDEFGHNHFIPSQKENKRIKQTKINVIAGILAKNNVHNYSDLKNNFSKIIGEIVNDPHVFKKDYSSEKCFHIFRKALAEYSTHESNKIALKP